MNKKLCRTGAIVAGLLTAWSCWADQPPGKAANGKGEHGRELFVKYGCFQCHGYEGQGGYAGARIAPNPIPYPAFISYIRQPKGLMPAYSEKLLTSEQDLADIYEYLKTRKPPVPTASLPGK